MILVQPLLYQQYRPICDGLSTHTFVLSFHNMHFNERGQGDLATSNIQRSVCETFPLLLLHVTKSSVNGVRLLSCIYSDNPDRFLRTDICRSKKL